MASFPLFNSLPPELRLQIWQESVVGRKIQLSKTAEDTLIATATELPALFGVCAESQSVFRAIYQMVIPGPVWVNFDIDILVVDLCMVDLLVNDIRFAAAKHLVLESPHLCGYAKPCRHFQIPRADRLLLLKSLETVDFKWNGQMTLTGEPQLDWKRYWLQYLPLIYDRSTPFPFTVTIRNPILLDMGEINEHNWKHVQATEKPIYSQVIAEMICHMIESYRHITAMESAIRHILGMESVTNTEWAKNKMVWNISQKQDDADNDDDIMDLMDYGDRTKTWLDLGQLRSRYGCPSHGKILRSKLNL